LIFIINQLFCDGQNKNFTHGIQTMKIRYLFLFLFLLTFSNVFSQGIIIHKTTGLDTVVISTVDSITFTQSLIVNKNDGTKDSVLLSNIDSVTYDPTINHTTTKEDFETGTLKSSYAAADVTFKTGIWNLSDALVGNTTADVKNGTRSVRMRLAGKLTMKFNFTSGAGVVTVQHAIYNNSFDGPSKWQLWYSVDNGITWQQKDSTVSTTTTTFQTASFTMNTTGFIRFEIRRIDDATTDRINFDDFTVTSYGASNTNPTPIITSIDPTSDTLSAGPLTLTVSGSNFLPSSVVVWNNNTLVTTYISSVKLQAVVPILNSIGTVKVTVFTPNGGTSAALNFNTIYGLNNPAPVVRYMSPAACLFGKSDFNITMTGNYFVSSSVVQWNGVPLVTTFVSSTLIRAAVPASLVATTGMVNVSVYTAPPMGGTSSSLTFKIYDVVTPTNNINLTMGNPSGAVSDTNYPSNFLIQRGQYCTSYNRDRGIPNWTAWELDATWSGSAVRQDNYIPDPLVPAQWYHVTANDYTNTGFSKGHMCPSEDRTKTQADNDSLFYMTNMIPQTQTLNGGPWETLESYCRTLSAAGNKLYIYSGTYGEGGTGVYGYMTQFPNGKVTVPAQAWKVIMVLPAGTNDLSRVNASTRCIAVIMNNDEGPFGSWQSYRVSVDSVEALTGLDFFSNVPVDIQAAIESVVDSQ
jgi:endonuclease G, mitochondrial